MDRFREALEFCKLEDLGCEGDKFTWRNNNHRWENYIQERLDRAAANEEWRSKFHVYRVVNGDHMHSDHRPVIVSFRDEGGRGGGEDMMNRGRPNFKFEARWFEEEHCDKLVKEAWREAMTEGGLSTKEGLKQVASKLQHWSTNTLGCLEKRVKKAKKEVERWRRMAVSKEKVAGEEVARYRLELLEEQVNTFWKQRAHTNWLQKGDKNTTFFHSRVKDRRRVNTIGNLKMQHGRWAVKEEEKKDHITNYFSQLFRSGGVVDHSAILTSVECKVTRDMNYDLLRDFSPEEVKAALDEIGDLKAPGEDGMPAVFYKHYWEDVGVKITRDVLAFLNGGAMPEDWNNTSITLIPKMKILIVSKICGKEAFAAVKLDMSKAYDRVEWHFLEAMMLKMGFQRRFVELIMQCVTTVKYRVKVNGDLTDEMVPTRGLRQGDLLSPYLFLLCAEAFSSLLRKAEDDNLIQGVKICPLAPSISHLLFADDSLILF
ncbi:hypothetical protein QYE76_038594 [Lolium multiflorum]|uniref:Reverse transcriptase domain-containing protein n=1 Tax=Lolium multiflorum TaxID=4521 RepID=A0AAD8WT09_LOLMU|nr:hypothetical protein QYE76_038594 [Lolium multiflorum]